MAGGSIATPTGGYYLPSADPYTQDGHTVQPQQVAVAEQPASTGTITTSSSVVGPVSCVGYQSVKVFVSGTYAGVSFLIKVDYGDGTFQTVRATRRSTGLIASTLTPGTNGSVAYVAQIPGAVQVEVLATAYTSGTANVRIIPVASPAVDDVVAHLLDSTGLGLLNFSPTGGNLTVTAADSTGAVSILENSAGSALASAARTVTTNGSDIVNYSWRGVKIFLNITNIVTACSIQANVQGKDPVSGTYYKLAADPTAVTATGLYVYEFYPGSSTAGAGGVTLRVAAALPLTWRAIVTAGNANSITYSVGYALIR